MSMVTSTMLQPLRLAVPKVDMARVERLLQMMCHIDFENESKQTMSIQSRYVIQKL